MTGMRVGTTARWGAALVVTLAAATALFGCAPTTLPVELAGPSAPTWVPIADSPLSDRHQATVVWVEDRFVVTGGDDGPACPPNADCVFPSGTWMQDGAAYDPVSDTWTTIADVPMPLVLPSTAAIGPVLYAFSEGLMSTSPTFVSYDTTTDVWTELPLPPHGSGALVAAGDVLLSVPGSDEAGPAVDQWFDPTTETWHRLPDDPLGPSYDRNLVVVDRRMFLTAKDLVDSPGADGPSLVRMAELDAAMETWTVLPDTELIGWEPVSAGGRLVFPDPSGADGGEIGNWGRPYPNGGIYVPETGTWLDLPTTAGDSSWPRLVVGDLVRVGDALVDPVSLDTTPIPAEPWADVDTPSLAASPDQIIAWGALQEGSGGWIFTP